MVRGVSASLPAFLVSIPVAFADPSLARWIWLFGSLAVIGSLRAVRVARRLRAGRHMSPAR